jgi:hypothetical protein
LGIEVEMRLRAGIVWATGAGQLQNVSIAPEARIAMTRTELVAVLMADQANVAVAAPDGTGWTVIEGISAPDLQWSPAFDGPMMWEGRRPFIADPYTDVVRDIPMHANIRARWPSFSGDGRWIYFTDRGTSGRGPMMRVNLVGDDPEVVIAAGDGLYNLFPDLSHDGSNVAYGRQERLGDSELYVMDLGRGFNRSLGVFGAEPEWSPDDQQIAYLPVPRPSGIRLIGPGGGGDRELVADPVHIGFSWSRDGRYIYAASEVDNTAFRVDVTTDAIEPLPALGSVVGIRVIP